MALEFKLFCQGNRFLIIVNSIKQKLSEWMTHYLFSKHIVLKLINLNNPSSKNKENHNREGDLDTQCL